MVFSIYHLLHFWHPCCIFCRLGNPANPTITLSLKFHTYFLYIYMSQGVPLNHQLNIVFYFFACALLLATSSLMFYSFHILPLSSPLSLTIFLNSFYVLTHILRGETSMSAYNYPNTSSAFVLQRYPHTL